MKVTTKSAFPVLVSVTVCAGLPPFTRLITVDEKVNVDRDRLACCENTRGANRTTETATRNLAWFTAQSPVLYHLMQRLARSPSRLSQASQTFVNSMYCELISHTWCFAHSLSIEGGVAPVGLRRSSVA